MKTITFYFTFFIFAAFILVGCSNSDNKAKLLNVYKEILIAREKFQDSIQANQEVQKVLKKNGYSENQFRNEIFRLAQSEKDFLKTIDSLRNYVKNEQSRILEKTNPVKSKKKLD